MLPFAGIAGRMKPRSMVSRFISSPAGTRSQQQLVPGLRPREALVADRQTFREPVRHQEVGLLQVEDVDDLVPQHPRPVERLGGCPLACGEAMATIRPVQAPMVCRSGRAIVRPLNISWVLNTSIRIGPFGA